MAMASSKPVFLKTEKALFEMRQMFQCNGHSAVHRHLLDLKMDGPELYRVSVCGHVFCHDCVHLVIERNAGCSICKEKFLKDTPLPQPSRLANRLIAIFACINEVVTMHKSEFPAEEMLPEEVELTLSPPKTPDDRSDSSDTDPRVKASGGKSEKRKQPSVAHSDSSKVRKKKNKSVLKGFKKEPDVLGRNRKSPGCGSLQADSDATITLE